jgi:transcriptional regulator NrdR family protein
VLRCKCGGETAVVDTREADNNQARRRRECIRCKERFTTYEKLDEKLEIEQKNLVQEAKRLIEESQSKINEARIILGKVK